MAKKELTAARETAQTIKPGRLTVKLRSVGNPDHRQYAPVSDPATVFVNSLREASEECRKYITEWDLGGGNWPETFVMDGRKKVARISYNGRVWEPEGEWPNQKEINIEPTDSADYAGSYFTGRMSAENRAMCIAEGRG